MNRNGQGKGGMCQAGEAWPQSSAHSGPSGQGQGQGSSSGGCGGPAGIQGTEPGALRGRSGRVPEGRDRKQDACAGGFGGTEDWLQGEEGKAI